jgi:hypothetical protein
MSGPETGRLDAIRSIQHVIKKIALFIQRATSNSDAMRLEASALTR